MQNRNPVIAKVLNVLVFLFLYLPIAVLIIFSFNDSKSRTVWSGFSLHWYQELFQDEEILSAFSTTLTVSVLAALIATVLGTAAAIGFHAMKRRPRHLLMTINNIQCRHHHRREPDAAVRIHGEYAGLLPGLWHAAGGPHHL